MSDHVSDIVENDDGDHRSLLLRGPGGYQDEELSLSDTSNNGLRLQILNDDIGSWAVFNIHSRAEAKLIAERLLAWSNDPVCGPFQT